ncbi:LicD family protein [Ectopseudomonas alcaliphila]|uniref:LicD family protein n=1 Tax=Ectopseudomonas alcaliphila TaxID=101564 RepID=UPI0027897272|nr:MULTISPECIES: LicD family protein [Pseudomonas]MDP9940108.1 hypothetical protein [Pseudomonas sp. 3400]MDR7012325.1 hypothetical protein [Pseudomonas alcaliphila]
MSKIRIRSESELAEQGKNLALVKEVLVGTGITPIISGGTLLGAVRDKDFIAWDWDAEFFCLYDEVSARAEELLRGLRVRGFVIEKQVFEKNRWKIVAEKEGFQYELRSWYRDGDDYRRDCYRIPVELMEGMCTVVLRDVEYFAPLRKEDYLTHVYGDWKTPVRTEDKSVYNSVEHFSPRRLSFWARFLSFLKLKSGKR